MSMHGEGTLCSGTNRTQERVILSDDGPEAYGGGEEEDAGRDLHQQILEQGARNREVVLWHHVAKPNRRVAHKFEIQPEEHKKEVTE